MRSLTFFLATSLGCEAGLLAFIAPGYAQVDDAERSAARDLFKQGDVLQRSARFEAALEKFQRADQIYSAPTNELRIAECEAALGRLAESAEAYRTVIRTTLTAASPAAFQAAVDQARAELDQVEPRVPKLTLQAEPAGLSGLRLSIDGQSVPAAVIGQPMSLDPGPHHVILSSAGYASAEEGVVLKEHETRVLLLTLTAAPTRAIARVDVARSAPEALPPPPPPFGAEPAAPTFAPAPPPPVLIMEVPQAPRRSRTGLLFGAHLGAEFVTGNLPTSDGTSSVKASEAASGGFAYGVDAGVRLARRWYLGLSLEHANFQTGTLQTTALSSSGNTNANATLLGALVAFIATPDRPSFYAEAGLGIRWFDYDGVSGTASSRGGEFTFGAGVWIPAGRSLRLLPKATLALGTLAPQNGGLAEVEPSQAFFSLVFTGFYNIDL